MIRIARAVMDQSFASSVAVLDREFAIWVAVYRLDNDFGSFISLVSQQECGVPGTGGVLSAIGTGFSANISQLCSLMCGIPLSFRAPHRLCHLMCGRSLTFRAVGLRVGGYALLPPKHPATLE